jgi:sulfate/thiosulfate transport system permease protein
MSATIAKNYSASSKGHRGSAVLEPFWIRWLLIGLTLVFLSLFLLLPLVVVFMQAFERGWRIYLASLYDTNALAAIRLTLFVAIIVVPINTIFGVCAAWAISKFEFVGKSLLTTMIDLPYSVSPVIAGMVFVLLFSPNHGWFGPWLNTYNIQLVFSVSGIVLATLFVTFPFVARELIPLMQSQGTEEEEAARVLGASGWQIFRRVTLPNIKWGLLYGIILCNARTMGEFGAVSVVSGRVSGETCTIPLQVENLYNENIAASFALASLLAVLALLTLILKSLLEWKGVGRNAAEAQAYVGD